jgi:O-antigen ligase
VRVIEGGADRGPLISLSITLGALTVLSLTTVMGLPSMEVAALVTAAVIGALAYRVLLQWHALVTLMILVIIFVPIKRYRMPGELPFELEPYRVVVALVAAAWLTSLLIDPRVRLRATGFELPLLLFAAAALGSYLVNGSSINALGVEAKVIKELTFLASFLVVLYMIASVARTTRTLDFMLQILVGGGAVVALFAIVEGRTGFNPFNHLGVLPFLEPAELLDEQRRAGRFRAYGTAQHPIALGAALVLLLPLAVYLARRRDERRWWGACLLLTLGALATMSRTSILMLFAVGLIVLWLRPRDVKRIWPALLPLVVLVHFALPGTIGGLKQSFFPEGGLLADQSKSKGSRGQGRVADLGPAIAEFKDKPILGQGFGSRVVDGESPNAQILDNQWLVSLLETGFVGVLALILLFLRTVRRLGRAAKEKADERSGWLFTALAASIGSFAVGMFTYDAFSFVQVTFFLFILIGIAAAALSLDAREGQGNLPPSSARARGLPARGREGSGASAARAARPALPHPSTVRPA